MCSRGGHRPADDKAKLSKTSWKIGRLSKVDNPSPTPPTSDNTRKENTPSPETPTTSGRSTFLHQPSPTPPDNVRKVDIPSPDILMSTHRDRRPSLAALHSPQEKDARAAPAEPTRVQTPQAQQKPENDELRRLVFDPGGRSPPLRLRCSRGPQLSTSAAQWHSRRVPSRVGKARRDCKAWHGSSRSVRPPSLGAPAAVAPPACRRRSARRSARCARRSVRSPLGALAARCARRSVRSPLGALAARCARRSVRSPLGALARRSVRSPVARCARRRLVRPPSLGASAVARCVRPSLAPPSPIHRAVGARPSPIVAKPHPFPRAPKGRTTVPDKRAIKAVDAIKNARAARRRQKTLQSLARSHANFEAWHGSSRSVRPPVAVASPVPPCRFHAPAAPPTIDPRRQHPRRHATPRGCLDDERGEDTRRGARSENPSTTTPPPGTLHRQPSIRTPDHAVARCVRRRLVRSPSLGAPARRRSVCPLVARRVHPSLGASARRSVRPPAAVAPPAAIAHRPLPSLAPPSPILARATMPFPCARPRHATWLSRRRPTRSTTPTAPAQLQSIAAHPTHGSQDPTRRSTG